jgi:hypothetical protein
MYAEAVRLLREEKYQEALDKWQEIKGIDSKYPDRQRVQKAAKQGLAAQAKPASEKRRISLPKSLWIGMGGIVTIVVIILALNFSDADPTMYDDFDNAAYDGSYNKNLWETDASPSNSKYLINQEGGKLSIKINYSGGGDLFSTESKAITEPTFFEMRAFLDPTTTDVETHFYMIVGTDQGYTNCGVFGIGDHTQHIKCWSIYYGKKVEPNIGLDGIDPGWHVFRLEIEPETMKIFYVIDGMRVGEYVPMDSIPGHFNDFQNSSFTFWVGMNNYGPSKAPVGYIDYVRMGAIEDDPNR